MLTAHETRLGGFFSTAILASRKAIAEDKQKITPASRRN
jgi:hypothetical protein